MTNLCDYAIEDTGFKCFNHKFNPGFYYIQKGNAIILLPENFTKDPIQATISADFGVTDLIEERINMLHEINDRMSNIGYIGNFGAWGTLVPLEGYEDAYQDITSIIPAVGLEELTIQPQIITDVRDMLSLHIFHPPTQMQDRYLQIGMKYLFVEPTLKGARKIVQDFDSQI